MADGEMLFDARLNTGNFSKDANKLGSIVQGLGVFEIIKKGLSIVASSIDDAVSRYDTLNRFPKIMEQMGYGADTAKASMSKLSDSIQGLPTKLDDIVANTRQFTVALGDLDKGTDSAIALNNAFLASGASADEANRGTTQYLQMLSSGKVDMQSWKTLNETMTYALQKTAESFGFAGSSAKNDLYAALRDGDITFTEFNDRIIQLNEGVGGFAEVAKTATGGIGTAMTNLKTRTVIGVTAIIEALDKGLSKTRFQSIENIINSASTGIKNALISVAKVVEVAAANIVPLTAGVVAFGVAIKGVQLLSMIGQMGSITAALKAMLPAFVTTTAAKVQDAAATVYLTAAYAKDAIVKGLSTAATIANTAATKLATSAANGNIIAIIAYNAATAVATAAQWLWNAAMAANPIGLVIAGVVALVAAIVALVSWLNNSTAEYKAQKKEVEALAEKQEALNTSLDESAKAHADNINAVDASNQAGKNLLTTLKGMVDENGKVTASHEDAQRAIDDLNNAYDGLNLSYDEETGLLSASVDELEKYIDAKNSIAKTSVLDERRVELAQQQAQIEANLAEIEQKRILINNNANLSDRQKQKLLEELDGTTQEYQETYDALALDIEANNAAIEASNDTMANNTVNAYETINGARTSDGLNLKQLAKLYDTTTEQILADMEAQGLSMEQWATQKAATMTEEGLTLEQLAAKWGMTTDEVTAYMDEWGMSLDEFSDEMDATHTSAGLNLEQLAAKWGISTEEIKRQMAMQGTSLQEWSDNIDAKCDEVINSFEEIPDKYEKSADEMIAVLQTNAQRYSTWTANIATLSQTMSAEAIAELQKLGPEANSAIEEMIADPSKAAEFEESILAVMQAGAGGAQAGATDPRFVEAGSQVGQGIGEGVEASTEAEAAATQMIADVATAAETAVANSNFTSLGQKIAQDIVTGVSTSDMSGISTGLSTAMQAGVTSVNSALSSMKSQMQSEFTDMKTTAVNTVQQMMTSVVSGISTKVGAARSAANSVSTSVTTSYTEMKTKAVNIVQQMMTSFVSGISSKAGSARSAANTVSTNVTTAFTDMKTKAVNIVQQMMTSFVSGISSKAGSAKTAASGVATGVITEFESMKNKAKTVTEQMMTSVVTAIKDGTAKAKAAASEVVDAIISAINAKGTDAYNAGKNIGAQMANGMVAGLEANKGSVYAKADEIAKEAARRIKAALEVKSPSRVMEDIFANVVLGMIAGLEDEENVLYRVIDQMAASIITRIGVIPESMATALNQKLRVAVSANQLSFAGVPVIAAAAESPAGPVTNMYFYQTINSPKHTSPSENSREAEAMLRRAKWQVK